MSRFGELIGIATPKAAAPAPKAVAPKTAPKPVAPKAPVVKKEDGE